MKREASIQNYNYRVTTFKDDLKLEVKGMVTLSDALQAQHFSYFESASSPKLVYHHGAWAGFGEDTLNERLASKTLSI